MQALPDRTIVRFHLKDISDDLFAGVDEKTLSKVDGELAIIESLEVSSPSGKKEEEYYNIIFPNLNPPIQLSAISGYHLEIAL